MLMDKWKGKKVIIVINSKRFKESVYEALVDDVDDRFIYITDKFNDEYMFRLEDIVKIKKC